VCYMPRQSQPLSFDHPNFVWSRVPAIVVLIITFIHHPLSSFL
jgi:hypothetical protein